ncbi:uncharacterized protein TNCV_1801251 [Trichonephila clavipes]|nr:uncharacterized protein TNCV_1801251 [Trichonephila clavipes]
MVRFKVYEGHSRFKELRESIEDNERLGQPSTSRNPSGGGGQEEIQKGTTLKVIVLWWCELSTDLDQSNQDQFNGPGSIPLHSSFLVRGTTPNGGVNGWASRAARSTHNGAAIPNVLQPGAFVWFEKTQGPLVKILLVPGWHPMKQLAAHVHFLRCGGLLNDWSVEDVLARAGRPCLKEARAPCIAVETEAIASEAASGTNSAREAARRLGLPPSSVRNIPR